LFFALFLLLKDKQDMLFRIQQFSIFLQTKEFFSSSFEQPGDFLCYAGSFLTQFFYYPVLGIAIFVLFLTLVHYAVFSLCQVNKNLYFFSLIPSALFLLFVSGLDYGIYQMGISDIVYSQMLGFLFALLCFRIYRLFNVYWVKILFLSLIVIAGYPLAGFYALVGAIYICIYETLSIKFSPAYRKHYKKNYLVLFIGIVLIIAIPFLYYQIIYDSLNIKYVYWYGLPVFEYFFDNLKMPGISAIICTIPILLLLLNRFTGKIKAQNIVIIANLLCLAICFFVVLKFTNRDENFHAQLKIERALEERDWDTVLKVAKEIKTPTRAIVLYRNIALQRKNILCDRMFFYPHEQDASTVNLTVLPLFYYPLFYHYGQLNFSYRFAMESLVKFGMKVDYLKHMTKIALFNNELELARKYINILKGTMFHEAWATKYETYLNNIDLFFEDPEFKEIYDLMQYDDADWVNSSEPVESCILKHYVYLTSGTITMFDLSMSFILIMKSIPLFWESFEIYVSQKEHIPIHIQEAALLYARLENKDVSGVLFDAEVIERFNQFANLLSTYGGPDSKTAKKMSKTHFGNTFWYYYFYVN